MLLALTCGFALSQAFRTVAAIMAPPLQKEFGLTPSQLGIFAGSFHLAFGGLQLFMGIGIDVWGPRRTVLAVSPLAIAGALLAAFASDFTHLLLAQIVIGVGCAPAFVVCTVFISRRFSAERFATVSGATLGLGTVGLLLTGTPLAWLIQQASWRAGFIALAVAAAAAWLAIYVVVRDPELPAQEAAAAPTNPLAALRGYGELFRLPFTWGIIVLGLFTYASFLTLRGLWLGPLLVERHGFSLVQTGNVALAFSIISAFGPPTFGRLDPGVQRRRSWLVRYTVGMAVLFAVMAAARSVWVDVGIGAVLSLVSGYMVLQYADVRSAYPPRMIGRAMAVFTMAMFLGVALMQWFTGGAASLAGNLHIEAYAAVLGAIALSLCLGCAAFVALPAPARRAAD